MKKLSCVLLAMTLLLSLAACGGKTDAPAAESQGQQSSTPAPASGKSEAALSPVAGGASAADGGAVGGEFYDTGNFKVLVPESPLPRGGGSLRKGIIS